ncbi:MAG: flippase [Peptostreptococcales bacterium]
MNKIRNAYNRINNSKDAKTLVTNFGYLSLLQVTGYVFPLITMPYLARVIGVDGFGKVAFASAIVVWFQTVADWGFNYTATRDVAKNRDDKEKVSEIFSNVLWARCLLMIISFLLLLIVISIVPILRENYAVILVTFLLVPGHIMFPDWFFQAMERMKYITILNLLSKLLFTILVFVFIKEKKDFILQPLFISLGFLLSGIFAMYIILSKWKVKLKRPSTKRIFETIKGSTDVFINNIMPNLYNSFSVMLLGFFGGPVSNGLLNAGSRFVSISQQFMTVISRTFFPFLSRRIDKHSSYAKLTIYTSIIISFLLFITAPLLIKLFFTEEFKSSVAVLQIMSISVFLITTRNAYGINYMIIEGYEKQLRNLITFGSIIGFIISFPLIYFFDFLGAAINITLTQSIMCIIVTYQAKKIIKSKNRKNN